MKKLFTALFTIILMLSFSACGSKSENDSGIQGVAVRDSGEVSVTFKVPSAATVEDVLGSDIGDENIFCVTSATGSFSSYNIYWYYVDSGGILSRNGDVYRYAPKATVSHATGVSAPPNWALMYSKPEDDEIFKPEDADLLYENYGIKLNF